MSLDHTQRGRRIRLDHTTDRYTGLGPGALGTINFERDGQLSVTFDNGVVLSLDAAAGDRWTVLPDDTEPPSS